MKNEVNWGNGFAIGDSNTNNWPLKCLIFQTNEKSFTCAIFEIVVPINLKLVHSRISF